MTLIRILLRDRNLFALIVGRLYIKRRHRGTSVHLR